MELKEQIKELLCDPNSLGKEFIIDGYECYYAGYCVENDNFYFLFLFSVENIHTYFECLNTIELQTIIQGNALNCSVVQFVSEKPGKYYYGAWLNGHGSVDCSVLNAICYLNPLDKIFEQIIKELI
jgi:hypothetical protein